MERLEDRDRSRSAGEPGEPGGPVGNDRLDEFDGVADERCVERVRRGDAGALAELIRRYTPGLWSLFLRLFADREAAADLTQEVFLRVHAHVAGFDSSRRFKAWIYAIAWNLARDRFRARRRGGGARMLSLDGRRAARGGDDAAGGASFDVEDRRTPAPEAAVEAAEEAAWLRQALGRLEPAPRAIILLREVEGLSHEELADILGCKIGTVKSRLHRARIALKDILIGLRPDWFERPAAGRRDRETP